MSAGRNEDAAICRRVLAADGVIAYGMSATDAVGADVVAIEFVDELYCAAGGMAELRREFGLSDRGEVNLLVRTPRFERLSLAGRAHLPTAVVAVDLTESPDARTRRAGLRLLARALVALGGPTPGRRDSDGAHARPAEGLTRATR